MATGDRITEQAQRYGLDEDELMANVEILARGMEIARDPEKQAQQDIVMRRISAETRAERARAKAAGPPPSSLAPLLIQGEVGTDG